MINEEKCARCSETKSIDAFAIYGGKPYCYCRKCQREMSSTYYIKNRDAIRARRNSVSGPVKERKLDRTRKWRENNVDAMRTYNVARYQRDKAAFVVINRKKNLSRYGLSIEQYEAMYRAQNGACAVCNGINISGRRLAVDHDHATGKVRGLLCARCNSSIGLARESSAVLKSLAAYLDKHETLSATGVI